MSTSVRSEIAAALRFAFRYGVDLLVDVRSNVDHAVERLAGTPVKVVTFEHFLRLEPCFAVLFVSASSTRRVASSTALADSMTDVFMLM